MLLATTTRSYKCLTPTILLVSASIAASAGLFDQQCPESSLSKMVIGGERVDDPHILHDDKRDAIDHPPLLILMRGIEFYRTIKQFRTDRYHLDIRITPQVFNCSYRGRSPAQSGKRIINHGWVQLRLSRTDPQSLMRWRWHVRGTHQMCLSMPEHNPCQRK